MKNDTVPRELFERGMEYLWMALGELVALKAAQGTDSIAVCEHGITTDAPCPHCASECGAV